MQDLTKDVVRIDAIPTEDIEKVRVWPLDIPVVTDGDLSLVKLLHAGKSADNEHA